jgi:predicted nucleic acid-binding protein
LALYYLDTSALVKLYVREAGTEQLLRLVSRRANHRFAVLTITQVEFRSAIRKRERVGDIDNSVATDLANRFERHLETKFLRQVLNDSVLETATKLIDRYPLRAYDAVQLAGCLTLKATSGKDEPVFVCSDRQLLEAAACEGLSSIDPSESTIDNTA